MFTQFPFSTCRLPSAAYLTLAVSLVLNAQQSSFAAGYGPDLVLRNVEVSPIERRGVVGASYPPSIVLRMSRTYRVIVPIDTYGVPLGSTFTVRTYCPLGTHNAVLGEARVIMMDRRIYACYNIYPWRISSVYGNGPFIVRTVIDVDREVAEVDERYNNSHEFSVTLIK